MKYYLTWLKTKWNKEEIATWRSMVKVLYVLLPIAIYSLLQDLIEIFLWAAGKLRSRYGRRSGYFLFK